MTGATLATWNCDFTATDQVTTVNVLQLLDKCQAAVLTESRSSAVDSALAAGGFNQWRYQDSDVRIVWDWNIWNPGPGGAVPVHGEGPGPHLPAREVTWKVLEHRASGARHVLIGSHVTAGYASPEDQPHRAWREQAARRHLLTIVEVTADLAGRFDYVHLGGDLNAKPRHRAEWWYPSRILDSLYVPDTHAGLDYLTHTHSSADAGLRVTRRWTEPLGAEGFHPAHYKRVAFPKA